jgi:hypothetical protein
LIKTERHTHNSTYPKGLFSFSKDSFVVNQTLVFQIKFCGKSPALWVAVNRQAVKKPNFNIYLQKNNAKISLEFASACLPECVFQTAIFC